MTTSNLHWDIYTIIAKHDWKLIPKLMRTCKTLYSRLKEQYNTLITTMPPTMYEQLKYVREVLARRLMSYANTYALTSLWKPGCDAIHLTVRANRIEPSIRSFKADSRTCFDCGSESSKHIGTIVDVVKRYLDEGYKLEYRARICCLELRPITPKQRYDIVMREFHRDLRGVLGCDVKEYLVKHPILDAKSNKEVYKCLRPEDTNTWMWEEDVYNTLVQRLCILHYPSLNVLDVKSLLKVLSEL